MKKKLKKIEGKKFYSLYEIAKENFFGIESTNFSTIKTNTRYMIMNDRMYRNILDASIVPCSKVPGRTKYAIMGQNIIRYLAIKEDHGNSKD